MSTRSVNLAAASSASCGRVAVVGGGITGLTAAYRLQAAGVAFELFEASERLGGKLRTERSAEGFVMELGADAILTRKPWALALAREIGLGERVVGVNPVKTGTYVLHGGRPVPLPEGLSLLVPTKWGPFLRSPLFTPWGKARAALEMVIPRRREMSDETLASFIRRRLGQEMLTKVAEPMLAGVFNRESERQSILATFPQFPALEKESGSLIRGLRARGREAGGAGGPAFFSFPEGTEELATTLAAMLNGPIHLSTPVTAIERNGRGFAINGVRFDAVLLATPAAQARLAVRGIAPEAAAALEGLRHTGIGTVYLAFHRRDVPHALDGYGVVIPRDEGRRIDGMMWTSSKWSGRAPEGTALIRLFFGGPHTREVLGWSDERTLAMAREEVREILGVSAAPVMSRIARWPEGYPQNDLGHLDRVAAVEGALPGGVVVAGAAYRGVGVPDCVRQGNEAALKLISFLKDKVA